jgi:nucleotide-binding universal stress UspA family protein
VGIYHNVASIFTTGKFRQSNGTGGTRGNSLGARYSWKRLRAQAKRILADIRYRFVVANGSVPEEIVRAAQDYGVAEIVIGKRGHRPLDEVLVGSVSQAVLASSTKPVVIVEGQ